VDSLNEEPSMAKAPSERVEATRLPVLIIRGMKVIVETCSAVRLPPDKTKIDGVLFSQTFTKNEPFNPFHFFLNCNPGDSKSNKPVASFVAFATPFEHSVFKATPFFILTIVHCLLLSFMGQSSGVHWISKSSPSAQ
jgi:hypothetical protein